MMMLLPMLLSMLMVMMLLSLSRDGVGAMRQTQAGMHWRCGAIVTRARVGAAAVPLPRIWVPRRGRWRKECGSFCGAMADGKWLARGAVWGGHGIASPRIGELLEASWTTSDQSTEPSGAISTASRRADRHRRLLCVRETTTPASLAPVDIWTLGVLLARRLHGAAAPLCARPCPASARRLSRRPSLLATQRRQRPGESRPRVG